MSVASFKVVAYICNATSPKVIWSSSWDFLLCSFYKYLLFYHNLHI